MCENDAAVDAWIRAAQEKALKIAHDTGAMMPGTMSRKYEAAHYRGVIRELAATVPGAREWLLANMPGEG